MSGRVGFVSVSAVLTVDLSYLWHASPFEFLSYLFAILVAFLTRSFCATMDAIPGALDPGDHGPGIIAGNVTVAVLATIAVALRVLARHKQRLALEADDYLIFVALVRVESCPYHTATANLYIISPLGGPCVPVP